MNPYALQYNRDFQINLLANLMADPKFFADNVGALRLTDFDLPACRLVFEVTRKLFFDYKMLPVPVVLEQSVVAAMRGLTPVETIVQEGEYEILGYVLNRVAYPPPSIISVPYFRQELLPYLRFVRTAQAQEAAGDDPEALIREMGKINDELRRFSTSDIVFVNAMDPLPAAKTLVPRLGTGLNVVDQHINGGLQAGETGMIIACTGVGKTCGLINFAVHCAWRGKYGLFITLELPGVKITERYQCMLAHIDAHLFRVDPADWPAAAKARLAWATGPDFPFRRNIQVFDASIRATGINEVEQIIIKWKSMMIEQFNVPPDQCMVVYVDWLEKLTSDGIRGITKNTNDSTLYQKILEGLGEIARRHNVILWTATQATRAAVGRQILTIDHTAHSIHANDPLDVSLGLAPVPKANEDVKAGTVTVECWDDNKNEDDYCNGNTLDVNAGKPLDRWLNASMFKTRYSAGAGRVLQFYQSNTLKFWDTKKRSVYVDKFADDGQYDAIVRDIMGKMNKRK